MIARSTKTVTYDTGNIPFLLPMRPSYQLPSTRLVRTTSSPAQRKRVIHHVVARARNDNGDNVTFDQRQFHVGLRDEIELGSRLALVRPVGRCPDAVVRDHLPTTRNRYTRAGPDRVIAADRNDELPDGQPPPRQWMRTST